MVWFANKGQIVQIAIALAQFSLAIVVLIRGWRDALPAMSSGNFFSAGAVVFYLLAGLVLASVGVSIWFSLRRRGEQVQEKSLPLSPQDTANGEKIVVFFRAYGDPASGELQQIVRGLLDQFQRFRVGDTRSEGHEIIAQLVSNGPYRAWSSASSRLRRVVNGQEKTDGIGLDHLLGEFFGRPLG